MGRITAYFFILSAAFTWASLIALLSLVHLVAIIHDYIYKPDIKWSYSVFLAEDHLVSVIHGVHFKTTVSALLGHLKLSGSYGGTIMADIVNWCFYKLDGQLNHCENAIEPEDIFNWSPPRALVGVVAYWTMISILVLV